MTPQCTEPKGLASQHRSRPAWSVAVALLLSALTGLVIWQTREGLSHVDRMMAERSETLHRMVSTELRNVARYGMARLARLDEVLADVATSADVVGVSMERLDGAVRIVHGVVPEECTVGAHEGEGYVLVGSSIIREGPVRIDTHGCGACGGCSDGCPSMADASIAGDYRVVLVVDATPYLELRRTVWIQGSAGGVLLLALAFGFWLFQRQLQRSWTMRQALAVTDERARSLERLSRLAAGLAHEIKNPVGSLRGFAQLIAEGAEEGSTQQEYAELMVEELDAITRRVDRLRDLGRPTPPHFERMDPSDIVRRVTALLAPDLEARGLRVEHDLPSPGLDAWIDADRIRDLVVNLVVNAIEASPQGGVVGVGLRLDPATDAIVLEVADQGPGIPIEERERALRPFHSTKPGGMGLGLTVAQQAVEDHGGRLEVDEGARGGALIRARWPRRAIGVEA